ncbi:MAG: DNA polymerase subunit beta [Cyanobacteria bacterium]|jgi:predicted nucleotidyltransferase|nr:DNA polymerase subunit beta [Cyanobacteria bacterium GSL.Bin1]
MVQNFPLSHEAIKSFCQRWQITEFTLFGSVLRHDFNAESDIDVLVTFDANFQRGLNETLQIQEELETLLGREVDLIIKSAIAQGTQLEVRQFAA